MNTNEIKFDGDLHVAENLYGDSYRGTSLLSSNLVGSMIDGASSYGAKVGSLIALATAGAKIVGFFSDNLSTEKAYIDKDGLGYFAGGLLSYILTGSSVSSGTLTLRSTSDATKGKILFGVSGYDEVNNRLGLGTASPSKLLDLESSDTIATFLELTNTSVGGRAYYLETTGSASSLGVGKFVIHDAVSDAPRLVINSSGQTGLKTSTPENVLTLQDPGTATVNRDLSIRNGDVTNYHRLVFGYNAGVASGFIPASSAFLIGEQGGGYGDLGGLAIGLTGASDIIFATNNLERVRIDFRGDVGISTNDPEEKLDVNGRIHISQQTAPSSTIDRLYNLAGVLYWNGIDLTAGSLGGGTLDYSYNFGGPGFGRAIIADSGSVTITVPDSPYPINGEALSLISNDSTNSPSVLSIVKAFGHEGIDILFEGDAENHYIESLTNLGLLVNANSYDDCQLVIDVTNDGYGAANIAIDADDTIWIGMGAASSVCFGANVGMGGVVNPVEALDIAGRIYLSQEDAPYITTDRLYNLGGALYWNGIDLTDAGGFTWIEKSGAYTASDGQGILADTSGGGWTLTLPISPAIGDTVGVSDNKGTFDTNNLTIARNGSLIQGIDEDLICDLQDSSFVLIYSGATTGWKLDTYISQASGAVLTRFIDLTDTAKHTTSSAASGGGTTTGHIHTIIVKGVVCGLRIRANSNTILSTIEFFSDSALTKRIYYAINKDCYNSPYHADYTPWCIPHFNGTLTNDELYYTITNNGINNSTYDIEMTLIGEV